MIDGSARPAEARGKGRFLERGQQVTRLEAFVDAAFAFAVTLLVISIDAIPDSAEALIAALKGIPAFAASFALIALFWNAHARWSRRYGMDDAWTTTLSLLLVFLVLVYVYPLRVLFGSFFGWISGGWLPSGYRIGSFDDLRLMFAVYAIAWGTLGLVVVALYGHAWRKRDALALGREERIELRGDLAGWWMVPATGALSLLFAALLKPPIEWMYGLPGMTYSLMAFTGLVSRFAERRAARRIGRSPA